MKPPAMKKLPILILLSVLFLGCSTDDDATGITEEQLVGNQYAHLLFDTREECEAAQAQYFTNCAQVIKILNVDEAEVMVTDILYRTDFYVEGNQLVIQAGENTYEFANDIIFDIQENGNLRHTASGSEWILFEDDYYE